MRDIRITLPDWAWQFAKPARWKSMRGGRGSSKSWSVAKLMIMRMAGFLEGYPKRPVRIASCRDFNTNLDSSVKVVVEKHINDLGLDGEFRVMNREIRHRNGSVMVFHGVTRNPDSFLSMEDLDIFWMEQAEVLGEEMIKIEPTIRKPGSELWFVWNPNERTSWAWKRFVENPQPGDVSVHVNYNHNPWWTDELEQSRRTFLQMEPSLYPWVYLGEPNDGDWEHQVLPHALLRECVRAYRKGLAPDTSAMECDFGFDIAEGGRDKCSTVGRRGPCVEHFDEWPGVPGDLEPAAQRAHANTEGFAVWRMYYDAGSPMLGPLRKQPGDYAIRPVGFGDGVEGPDEVYEGQRTNGETFARRNIQLAMALRLRAIRTVALLNNRTDIDPYDCLFINPRLPRLEHFLNVCTKPIRRMGPQTGKWELDKRGGDENAKSPDPFDALSLCFARDSDGVGLKVRY